MGNNWAIITAGVFVLASTAPAWGGKERIDLPPVPVPVAGQPSAVLAVPVPVPHARPATGVSAGSDETLADAELQRLRLTEELRRGPDIAAARRIPGKDPLQDDLRPQAVDPNAVEPPRPNLPREFIPVPDRWRLGHSLFKKPVWWDPYNRNILKGDRPVFGEDWFVNIAAISDTVYEPRRVPTPIAPNSSTVDGTLDVFGDTEQWLFNENIILSLSLIKGDTAFKPQDLEFRLTPVINYNYTEAEEVALLNRDPAEGKTRTDSHIALQEAFVDYHIRNVSDRYDFDSLRAGIQPFSTDFRGFLFQDNQLGFRFFGNRANNVFQYNLAWFRRLEKDTNSGLNDVSEKPREDDIFIANLYIQDVPKLGFVSQFTAVYNRNREDDEFFFNNNAFLERPASLGDERQRSYDVIYLGFNGDGHFGRANLTASAYYAFGWDHHNQLNNSGPGEESDISAYLIALEPSVDFDWIRLRGSFLLASGDDDPFDDKETGFDAIFENPQFAGGDTSYWIRQGIPFIGGGGVALTQRNGVLASLRTSKEHGQSNFVNPGLFLLGFGTDFDILPELRISTNINKMYFVETAVLEALRNQGDIEKDIGWDISAAAIYRPFQSQNVVFRLSGAMLVAGQGFKDLYASAADPNGLADDIYYSVLANLILTY